MATVLYYTDTASALAIAGKVVRSMSPSRGSGVVTKTQASTGSSVVPVYDTGTTPLCFAYQVGAYSATTGSYGYHHWGSESNALANNYACCGVVSVYTAAGVYRFDVRGSFTKASTEYTTSPVAYAGTGPGTAQAINAGDWIVVFPTHSYTLGATGYTITFSYNGTSAAANGDSYMSFPDTITAYSAPAAGNPRPIRTVIQAVQRAASW